MPCKHAKLAAIYAQQMAEMDEPWKLWRRKWVNGKEWRQCVEPIAFGDEWEFEQIPKTIRIGNFDVPEPMLGKPENGTEYFYVSCSSKRGVRSEFWHGYETDNLILKRGICHTTKEAALAHAKALFSFSEIKD